MADVMRRAAAIAVFLWLVAPAQGATLGNWDKPEQRAVARAGVLPKLPGGFHGERPLTAGQLSHALSKLAHKPMTAPSGTITVTAFHRAVVKQLGLADVAQAVQHEAQAAGLNPPARFGTEVVARQLGLRYDHPPSDDRLELYPSDPITRAEAAYSFARVLENGSGNAYYAREVFSRFHLPQYTDKQRQALRTAVSKIGMPYVWAGESDGTTSRFGPQAHGGYDCSGFVWRVFKLSGNPAGKSINGRSADAIGREIPKRARIPFKRIQPGDLLFFYRPTIGHVGIALSSQFMIHSSSQGVAVTPLYESWRTSEFRWARRVL
jgi:cell wall-associated NlpC family hydrolase